MRRDLENEENALKETRKELDSTKDRLENIRSYMKILQTEKSEKAKVLRKYDGKSSPNLDVWFRSVYWKDSSYVVDAHCTRTFSVKLGPGIDFCTTSAFGRLEFDGVQYFAKSGSHSAILAGFIPGRLYADRVMSIFQKRAWSRQGLGIHMSNRNLWRYT